MSAGAAVDSSGGGPPPPPPFRGGGGCFSGGGGGAAAQQGPEGEERQCCDGDEGQRRLGPRRWPRSAHVQQREAHDQRDGSQASAIEHGATRQGNREGGEVDPQERW